MKKINIIEAIDNDPMLSKKLEFTKKIFAHVQPSESEFKSSELYAYNIDYSDKLQTTSIFIMPSATYSTESEAEMIRDIFSKHGFGNYGPTMVKEHANHKYAVDIFSADTIPYVDFTKDGIKTFGIGMPMFYKKSIPTDSIKSLKFIANEQKNHYLNVAKQDRKHNLSVVVLENSPVDRAGHFFRFTGEIYLNLLIEDNLENFSHIREHLNEDIESIHKKVYNPNTPQGLARINEDKKYTMYFGKNKKTTKDFNRAYLIDIKSRF